MAFTKEERDQVVQHYQRIMDEFLTDEHATVQLRIEGHVRRLAAQHPGDETTTSTEIWTAIERDDQELFAEYKALSTKAFDAAREIVLAQAKARILPDESAAAGPDA